MSDKPRWYKRMWAFFKDAKAELKKVTWPSRAEVTSTPIVVIVATVFFGFYLFFMDAVFGWAITKLKDVLG
jgi:preprotein translocase subunit SecE